VCSFIRAKQCRSTLLTKPPQIFQIFVTPSGQLVDLERLQIDVSQGNSVQISGNPIPPDDFRVYARQEVQQVDPIGLDAKLYDVTLR